MTRPDDIPEWAWEKANEALMRGPLFHISIVDWDAQQAVFAKAIIAAVEEEREACAALLDASAFQFSKFNSETGRKMAEIYFTEAEAIRNRS